MQSAMQPMPLRALGRVALATVLISGLVFAGPAGPASAAPLSNCYSDDNGSPVLDDIALSTDLVDVTTGPQSIGGTVLAHDTGGPGTATGIRTIELRTDAPVGAAVTVKLTSQDGQTWVGDLVIPRWTAPGTWQITAVYLVDHAGLVSRFSQEQLAINGWQRPFDVTSIRDTTPPKLTGFTATPSVVDTRTTARELTITAKVSDTQSGVRSVRVTAYKAGTRRRWTLSLHHTTGQLWSGKQVVPKWYGETHWTFGTPSDTAVLVRDRSLNGKAYTYADLGKLSFKRDYWVLSKWDRVLPTVSSVTATPHLLDVTTGDKSFTITVKAGDVGSGVTRVDADGWGYRIRLHRTSGTARSGTWTGTVHVHRCSAHSGSWAPVRVLAQDVWNPDRSVSPGDLPTWPKVEVTGRDLTVGFPVVESAGPAADVTVAFNEAVNGVTTESALVYGGGELHTGTWSCLNFNGAPVDCLTGKVRKALFNPDTDLTSGELYALLLDPEGVLALTDLAGNPFTRMYLTFEVP
jgi:hypothetical protein